MCCYLAFGIYLLLSNVVLYLKICFSHFHLNVNLVSQRGPDLVFVSIRPSVAFLIWLHLPTRMMS